jgi:urea transporter/murein DD-endopeptidase MepM/ murein hydrolase activator NlpD
VAAKVDAAPFPQSQLREKLALLADALTRSYAQVLFLRGRSVGLLLLVATAVSPRLFLAGFLSALFASCVALALSLRQDLIRSGLFGYNALLLGLGWAALCQLTPLSLLLLVVSVVASVFLTAAVHSALGAAFNLPALTVPFVMLFPLLLTAGGALGVKPAFLAASGTWLADSLPASLTLFLESLGAIFFMPRIDAGLVVLVALAVGSRIGVILAIVGFAVSQLIASQLAVYAHPLLPLVLGYNCLLTAIALGGVWFVPSRSSIVFAAISAMVAGLISLGLLPTVKVGGLPLLIVPFNVTVFLLLYAMRQRIRDRFPKSVDFLLGTPEENLGYFRTRLSRFGSHYALRFGAPFLGRWVCTQGVDGDRTHQGPWRYALDFEVADQDGALFSGSGEALSDYHCYRLPVLAPADGTVAKVVDGIADNLPGQINLEQNWGNLVLIYHAPGLYSLLCHLSPRSIEVQAGQQVRRGDRIGLCGASGRAPTPHLHFQLQATARIGAPTLYVELHDVIEVSDAAGDRCAQLHATFVPKSGDTVRNIEPQEDIAHMFTFAYGESQTLRNQHGHVSEDEAITPDIDLYGNLLLRSDSATLFYDTTERSFTVYDVLGNRNSVLGLAQAALCRVPFERGVIWRDILPRRRFLPWWARVFDDLIAPFARIGDIEMRYRMRESSEPCEQGDGGDETQDGTHVVITGESLNRHRGAPLLTTEAHLVAGAGLRLLRLRFRGREVTARACRAASPQHAQTAIAPASLLSKSIGLTDARRPL